MLIVITCETRYNGVREDEDFTTLSNYWENVLCVFNKTCTVKLSLNKRNYKHLLLL